VVRASCLNSFQLKIAGRMGLLKKPIISQTVRATLRGCPVFMPIFRVGTETYPLHSALFQQPQDARTTTTSCFSPTTSESNFKSTCANFVP